MTKKGPYTDAENAGTAAMYFAMLDKVQAGTAYNKAGMIRTAQGNPKPGDTDIAGDNFVPGIFCTLANRKSGSIEFKLMNCSQAHADLAPGAETMHGHGYVALDHYQASLKVAMQAELTRRYMDNPFADGAVIA